MDGFGGSGKRRPSRFQQPKSRPVTAPPTRAYLQGTVRDGTPHYTTPDERDPQGYKTRLTGDKKDIARGGADT